MIQYRNAADGQAFHRDTDMRWLDDTIIAVLSLGARRPWQLRPRGNRYSHDAGHGATFDVQPGGGDLLVMGGRCQADWEHSVPYLRTPVGVRISLQWRFARRTGKPFQGASYGAPLYYSSGQTVLDTQPMGDQQDRTDQWCPPVRSRGAGVSRRGRRRGRALAERPHT